MLTEVTVATWIPRSHTWRHRRPQGSRTARLTAQGCHAIRPLRSPLSSAKTAEPEGSHLHDNGQRDRVRTAGACRRAVTLGNRAGENLARREPGEEAAWRSRRSTRRTARAGAGRQAQRLCLHRNVYRSIVSHSKLVWKRRSESFLPASSPPLSMLLFLPLPLSMRHRPSERHCPLTPSPPG